MAETDTIAKMAEKVSNDIFFIFGWKSTGPKNQNWPCEKKKQHHKSTHPSDIDFCYENPYDEIMEYVNVDLKSYKSSSIASMKLIEAINNIGFAVECARVSQTWQGRHCSDDHKSNVAGMLFIYNHDGDFDGNFSEYIKRLKPEDIMIPKGARVYIFGPKEIAYLLCVANDIQVEQSPKMQNIPENYGFFYPQLISRKKPIQTRPAASIEMLLSPYIIVKYQKVDSKGVPRDGYHIYYRGTGESSDEFKYLLDMIFRFQLIGNGSLINVRCVFAGAESAALFTRAKDDYFNHFFRGMTDLPGVKEQRDRITFEEPPIVHRRFSEVSIGMETRHG